MIKDIQEHWNKIYQFIIKNEIDNAVIYCKDLKKDILKAIEKKLIQELIETKDNIIRNTTAIVLGDLKCNMSIDPMIKILKDKKMKGFNATMIYALSELDCADRIVEIFHILWNGNYESKCNLFLLLEEKIDAMKEEDKEKCLKALNKKIEEVEKNLEFLYDTAEKIFNVEYKD